MKKQNSFVKAGAVLALSGVVVKLLSAAYRIPLTRMLGADVMGRYSVAFNLFMPFFSFATAGITTSVAHFTAKTEAKDKAADIRKAALKIYCFIALILTAAFVLFSGFYAEIQQDKLFFYGSVILAPAILLAVAENVLKGESQGRMNMLPTAQANVLEGFFKTAAGLLGVWCVKQYCTVAKDEKSLIVCFATVTVSGLICTVFLLYRSKNGKKTEKYKNRTEISSKLLLKMSMPIGISALTVSLANFFDTAVCLPKLDKIPYTAIVKSFKGASFMGAGDITMYLFGIWQGMVISLFNLVPTVVATVGTAALPLISRSWAGEEKSVIQRHTNKLFCITSLLCVPAMAFIFCFGSEAVQLLFDTTPNQTTVALILLRTLCMGGIFCCFNSAFNSVLFAAGRSDKVFYILLSGCVTKAAASFILCGIPAVNIKAFAVSSVLFYTIIFMRSVHEIKNLGIKFNASKIFSAPVAAATAAVLAVNWLKNAQLYSLPLFLKLFFCGLIFALMYFLIIVCTGFLVDK